MTAKRISPSVLYAKRAVMTSNYCLLQSMASVASSLLSCYSHSDLFVSSFRSHFDCLTFLSLLSSAEPTLSYQDEERARRSEFVRELVLSTIIDDNL